MSAGMIHSYPVTATTFNDTSFWDLDKDLGSGNWESQKVPHLLLRQLILSENVEQILEADLQALAAANGLLPLKTYLCDGPDRLLIVRASSVSGLYQTAIDQTSGEIGIYDLTTGVFVTNVFPYVVISKANYETAYTNGALVKGTKYRIIDAIDTGFFDAAEFGNIDAVVLATSGSTIYEIAEYPEIDAFGQALGIAPGQDYFARVMQCGHVFTTTDAAYFSANNINAAFLYGATIMFYETNSYIVYLQVFSDNSGFQFTNVLCAATANVNQFGNYDLATGVFTANDKTVTFKVSFTDAEILAGATKDIVNCHAVSGSHWEVLSATAEFSGSTTPYDGGASILVVTNGGFRQQFYDAAAILAGTDTWCKLQPFDSAASTQQSIASNAKLTCVISDPSTVGDGALTVYGVATLIKD